MRRAPCSSRTRWLTHAGIGRSCQCVLPISHPRQSERVAWGGRIFARCVCVCTALASVPGSRRACRAAYAFCCRVVVVTAGAWVCGVACRVRAGEPAHGLLFNSYILDQDLKPYYVHYVFHKKRKIRSTSSVTRERPFLSQSCHSLRRAAEQRKQHHCRVMRAP